MGAVFHYENGKERKWSVNEKFTALVKCFIQNPGEKQLIVIEKPSTRPATFKECFRFAQKMKQEYGNNLKQIIIWNIDELQEKSGINL